MEIIRTYRYSIDVFVPWAQPLHIERYVQIYLSFGFGDTIPTIGQVDQDIRAIVYPVAFRVYIAQLRVNCPTIFSAGNHMVAVFSKAAEHQFKVAVSNDAVKDALFHYLPLIIRTANSIIWLDKLS